MTNPSTGLVQKGGFICPWNKTDQGPAKGRIHCLVWKDEKMYWDWGEDSQRFCSVICNYGHMVAEQRNRKQAVNAGFWLKKQQQAKALRYWLRARKWWMRPLAPIYKRPGEEPGGMFTVLPIMHEQERQLEARHRALDQARAERDRLKAERLIQLEAQA